MPSPPEPPPRPPELPRPPRALLPPRAPELRERVELARELLAPLFEPREDFAAPPELLPDDFAAPDERVESELADLARLPADFLAPLARVLALELFEAPVVERFAVDPDEDLRAPLERELVDRDEPEPEPLPPELSLPPHLPDMTRCAASATASAMIEPSLVALDIMLLAALDAVSAASRPASRIFLRAAGLALIAAAAAARPAASTSLLMAAFASFSTLLSLPPDEDEPEPDDEEREELLRVDLAMLLISLGREQDT